MQLIIKRSCLLHLNNFLKLSLFFKPEPFLLVVGALLQHFYGEPGVDPSIPSLRKPSLVEKVRASVTLTIKLILIYNLYDNRQIKKVFEVAIYRIWKKIDFISISPKYHMFGAVAL